MNRIHLKFLGAFFWLTVATSAQDRAINLRAMTTITGETVILDLLADTNGISLRSFGIAVNFDPAQLELESAGRYEQLWFLSRESGERLPYTDTRLTGEGRVRLIGGRLAADLPGEGVSGQQVLLATLVFNRLDGTTPDFSFDLPGTPSFANFVEAGGDSVDDLLDLKDVEIVQQPASIDSDEDGLPDDFEIEIFGDLERSDGTTDTDGDGDSDYEEWVKGTDPRDPQSKCVLTVQVLADGSKLLQWNGKAGRVYEIMRGDTPEASDVLASGLPGTTGESSRLDETSSPDPAGFYRIKVRFPTAR